MFKKIVIFIATLTMIFALAACSAAPSSASNTNSSQTNGTQPANRGGSFGGDPAKMTVEQKIGIGILKLEGTPNAVTAAQAKDLLPLWQALKSMQTSNNASIDEINAVFTQMTGTLTPAQVTAIKSLTWTQTDLTALMTQYGVPNGFGGSNGSLTPAQQATRTAARANGAGAPGSGGNGSQGGSTSAGSATRTPSPAQLNRQAMGMNSIFIDPIIKLLTSKNA